MYTLAEIERAIVNRLKDRLPYLEECASLGSFLLDELDELTLRCPAAYVVYQQGEYGYGTSGVQDRRMRFTVALVVRNERGDESTRHGRGPEIGIYRVLDDVRIALTGQTCGLAIDPLLPLSERAIGGSSEISVYGITVQTRCRFVL